MLMPRIICNNCNKLLGFNVEALSGDIGPSVYKCRSCEDCMSSGRSEWLWHSRPQKNRYKMVSIIFAIVYGFLCTALLTLWISANIGETPDQRLIYVMFGTAACATVFVQWLRVMISVIRDSNGDIRPLHVWIGSFETNTLFPLIFPPIVAAFSYWFVAPLL